MLKRGPASPSGAGTDLSRNPKIAVRRSPSGVERLLNLQRTHGNAFVQRLVRHKPANRQDEKHERGTDEGSESVRNTPRGGAIHRRQALFRIQRQAEVTCNGQSYNPKRFCCTNGKLVPQTPIQDLEECPDRKQLVGRPNEYDGCSVPWFLRIGEDKDNPAGGRDTAFSDASIHGMKPQAFVPTLPCDVHDKCYQTCNPDPVARELCDMKLIVEASKVCTNSTENDEVKKRCREAVEKANYFLVRHGFGEDSFEERQRQYCHCCPLPTEKEKKRQLIANTENVRLVSDPIHWDEEAYILRRLPKGTVVKFRDDGGDESFNNTAPEYKWWWVEVDGVKGWVMQVLLDERP
jgi:hypothetical protein